MDAAVLIAGLALLVIVASIVLRSKGKEKASRQKSDSSDNDVGEEDDRHNNNVAAGRGVVDRRHRRQQPVGEGEAEGEVGGPPLSRLQQKKIQKQREKEERRAAVEAGEDSRRQRELDDQLRDEQRALDEEELQMREEKALAQLREEKKQRDDEEYAMWKGQMGVEERGEVGDEVQRRTERVIQFLTDRADAVRSRAAASPSLNSNAPSASGEGGAENVMVLQDAARTLGVTVEQLVLTMEQLLRDDVISGVFDERGKFVFIAEIHFEMIAKFMKLRGRVSVSELARECNKMILQ